MIVVGIRSDDPRHVRWRDHVSHTPQLHDDTLRGESRLNEAGSEFLAREYIKQFRQQRWAAAQLENLCSGAIEQPSRRSVCRDYA